MTELEKAARMALEFCELCWRDVAMNDYALEKLEQTTAALTQALATTERKGEPVYQICMADSVSISTAWVDVGKEAYDDAGLYPEYRRRTLYTSPQVPEGFALVKSPITEAMHTAACKVLTRSTGLDGLPQRMLDAMIDAARKGE